MEGPLTAVKGFYRVDAAEALLFVVKDAVTVYRLHFHTPSPGDGVPFQKIGKIEPQVGGDALLFFRREGNRTLSPAA